MGPGQHDVRRHRADRDRLVLDIGNVAVGWPIVRHQPGVGGDDAEHESVDLVLAETLDHLQPGAARRATVDFDGAGTARAPGCPGPGAAWRTTSRRSGTSRGRAGFAVAVPRCRWSASPSKTRPRTTWSRAACWRA